MARVFAKPTYVGELERLVELDKSNVVLLAGARHTSKLMSQLDAEDLSLGLTGEQIDELYAIGEEAGIGKVAVSRGVALFEKFEAWTAMTLYGGDAVNHIFKHLVANGVAPDAGIPVVTLVESAEAIALAGCVGGFGSAIPCGDMIKRTNPASVLLPCGSRALDWVILADNIRLGTTSGPTNAAWAALRAKIDAQEDIYSEDLEDLANTTSRIKLMCPKVSLYSLGSYTIMADTRATCVLSSTDRFNLAACIHSYAMWAVTAALDQEPLGRVALDFVHKVLCSNSRVKTWELARYLKSEYAIIICNSQVGSDESLLRTQLEGLRAESRESRPIGLKNDFSDVMGSSSPAINYGTVWNVLPPCSIDPTLLAQTFQAKCSSVHPADDDAWDEFMVYARTVLSAHYLHKNPRAEVRWAKRIGSEGEPEWATNCRNRKLTYYRGPAREADWIVGSIPWTRVLEGWHHTAADVTHVWAESKLNVDNELAYAMEHAPKLSGVYMPSDVRAAWEQGEIPGQRILYGAGKSENTKFGAKVRETMSADDVLREVLSEVDMNLTTIGRCVEGVTMRAGRAGTERMIRDVVSHGDDSRILLSLDVSGWSPNMIRRKELAFIDMMLDMYDIPAGQRVSPIFGTPTIRFKKAGMNMSYPMVDGSVQGFFGTGDTIMHSLIAQFAFHKGKAEGVFGKGAKMRKCVLIDDILCSLDSVNTSMTEAVSHFTSQYNRLGFKVDVVKTLASRNVGTFLNRVYTPTGEVLTYAKIAARADREWDRPVIGIIDEVSSVFSGYAGATDRGMNAVLAYYLATLRSIMRIAAITNYRWAATEGFLALTWFGPNSWGGLGVPNATEWISGGGLDGTESKASTMVTIYEMAKAGGYVGSSISEETLRTVAGATVSERGPAGVWANPSGTKLKGVPDCQGPLRDVLKSAIATKFPNSALARMVTLIPDARVKAWLLSVLQEGVYPAPVLAAAWSTTPYAVANDTLDRYVSCQGLLRLVSRRKLRSALKSVHRASCRLITFASTIVRVEKYTGELGASDIHRALIEREGLAHHLVGVIQPTAFEYIRLAAPGSHGGIRAFIPACANPKDVPKQVVGARTYSSERAKYTIASVEIAKDPVMGAVKNITRIAAILKEHGMDSHFIYESVMNMWGHRSSTPPAALTGCSNYLRLLPGFCKTDHCVRAMPNYAPRIKIDAHRAMAVYDYTHKMFDWMTTRAAVQAMCTLDASAGLPEFIARLGQREHVREYIVLPIPDMFRPPSNTACMPLDSYAPVSSLDPAQVKAYEMLLNGGTVSHMAADELFYDTEDECQEVITDQFGAEYRIRMVAPHRKLAAAANLGSFMGALYRDNPPAMRAVTDSEVGPVAARHATAANEGADNSSTGVVARWVGKYRSTKPEVFTRYVADSGAELGAYLNVTHEGRGLWKQIASRKAAKCMAAMAVLQDMLNSGQKDVGSCMKSWRLRSAAKYAKRSEDKKAKPLARYVDKIASSLASAAAEMSGYPAHEQFRAMLIFMRDCIATIYARDMTIKLQSLSSILTADEVNAINGRVPSTFSMVINMLMHVAREDVPRDYAQRDLILEAAKAACEKVLNWIMEDSVIPEARTEAFAHAAAAKAAPRRRMNFASMIEDNAQAVGDAMSGTLVEHGAHAEAARDDNDADV